MRYPIIVFTLFKYEPAMFIVSKPRLATKTQTLLYDINLWPGTLLLIKRKNIPKFRKFFECFALDNT